MTMKMTTTHEDGIVEIQVDISHGNPYDVLGYEVSTYDPFHRRVLLTPCQLSSDLDMWEAALAS